MAKKDDLLNDARFIFDGVVKKVNSSTAKENARANAVVVNVESVVRAPEALSEIAGDDVTVWLSEGEKLAAGERARFYTNPAHWGESIAVRSVGYTSASESSGRRAAATATPVRAMADRRLEEQVAKADTVVSGVVSAVRLPEEEAQGLRRASAGAANQPPQRISEHDPLWGEAVIDVHDTHKGQQRKQVVVRFPRSNDVRWRHAPKFHAGQQGVFLLHQEDMGPTAAAAPTSGRRGAGGPPAAAAYTVPTTADVQPMEREEAIKTLIRATGADKK
jgi:hypothetical protein